jgi:4-hydroxy-2-oxoheptanedioate aldolase
MRANPVKKLLKEGKPAIGTWLSLGNVLAARFLARSGFDWLTIDVEHSLVGMESTSTMLGTIADAGCIGLTRVPEGKHDQIKRMLDNGAHGIVVPMVNSRAEAELAVRACLYPPRGNRSVGGNIHALNWGATPTEYYAQVNDEILVVLQCEHIDAVRNFEEIYSVPGIDAIFVGPNDLAASMRKPDGSPPDKDEFAQALQTILTGCKKLGIAAGIHTFSPAEAQQKIAEGWQFLAIASELKMMIDGASAIVNAMGKKTGDLARY